MTLNHNSNYKKYLDLPNQSVSMINEWDFESNWERPANFR